MDPNEGQDYRPSCQAGVNLDDPAQAAKWQATERIGQQIRLAICEGQEDRALRLVSEGFALARHATGERDLLETPLATIAGIDARTTNTLEREADITTVGDLLRTKQETLLSLANFGDRTLRRLLAALLTHTIVACQAAEARVRELEQQTQRTTTTEGER